MEVEGSDGGTIPTAANLSGTSGFVNSMIGSFGSYINTNTIWLSNKLSKSEPFIRFYGE